MLGGLGLRVSLDVLSDGGFCDAWWYCRSHVLRVKGWWWGRGRGRGRGGCQQCTRHGLTHFCFDRQHLDHRLRLRQPYADS